MAVLTNAPYGWFAVNTDMTVYDGAFDGCDVETPNGITRTTLYIVHLPPSMRRFDLRLRYSNAATISQTPVIQPFGMILGSAHWQRLVNLSGVSTLALSENVTDIDDGTWKYTNPLTNWQIKGVRKVIIPTKTILTVSAGSTTGAQVEMLLRIE